MSYTDVGPTHLALQLNRSEAGIMAKALRMGITNQRIGRALQGKTYALRNTSCDIPYFSKPMSANMCYILGYIWADGCVSVGESKTHRLSVLFGKRKKSNLEAILAKGCRPSSNVARDQLKEYLDSLPIE